MYKNLLSSFFVVAMAVSLSACDDDDHNHDNDHNHSISFGTAPASSLINDGTVTVLTKSDARYHVIDLAGGYTSTLVETEDGVVMVDTGRDVTPGEGSDAAADLRAYADAIGKSIAVIITHDHSDHFSNLTSFTDVGVYAQSTIATALMADTGFTDVYSTAVIGVESSQEIAGLDYHFNSVDEAETTENGYITVPAIEALFAGDLAYNQSHNYIREYTPKDDTDELSNWIAGLNTLKTNYSGYNNIFVGHGGYSNNVVEVLEQNIDYLTNAQALIKGTQMLPDNTAATTNQQVTDELTRLFPDYAPGALKFALPGSFGENDPGADWF